MKLEYKKNINAKIEINVLECLSWNQTMCFSCKDPCLDDAITFLGMFIKVCPTNAIKIG